MEAEQALKNLTQAQAGVVYDVLVAFVGASPDADGDRKAFVDHFVDVNPTNEWRFSGSLGFGGKFRFPHMSVDCYPEDETPERLAAIATTNAVLSILKDAFLVDRAAIIEECAARCIDEHVGHNIYDDCENDEDAAYNRALLDAAAALRSMKSPPKPRLGNG